MSQKLNPNPKIDPSRIQWGLTKPIEGADPNKPNFQPPSPAERKKFAKGTGLPGAVKTGGKQ